ncbi:MAG: hypothetical protein LBB88_10495 [Planctomycetaceae bacterium]|nr:hypothetical protein [Planctomycetaceae bacterium]
MKKFTLFTTLALFLSACAIGCSTDGTNSFCRTGSLFPVLRSNVKDTVYTLKYGNQNNCDPCEPVQPCTPCEPVCNPCDNVNCVSPIGTVGPGRPTSGG